MNFGRKMIVCGSCFFKNNFALTDSWLAGSHLRGGYRLGFHPWLAEGAANLP
jgi:hypothetical protein